MSEASRDGNFVTTLLAVSSVDGVTPVTLYANPTTHRLLVDLTGAGSGTVTTVSVASANGFAGTVATATSTPAITISTTITGILKGNGTAISAITVGSGLSYDGTTLSATGGGTGTVTDVSVVTANGVSGSVATSTTTPAITLTLGAITPTSVSATSFVAATPATDTIAGVFRRNNSGQTANIVEIQTEANALLAGFDKAGKISVPSANVSGLTASEIVLTDASKNLVSAAVATYPSLTELSYVKGVTSGIQSQLNAKGTGNVTKVGTPVNNQVGVWTGDGTLEGDTALTFDTTTDRLSVGTSGILEVGTIELGHASDTTIARVSAGVASIEGNNIVTNTSSPTLATVTTTGNIELGNASDTTLSRGSAGVLAVEGVTIPSISSTNTLTNKRVTPRVGTTTSSATPTINTDTVDYYSLTAQTADITSFTTNLSGTPTDGQKLWISVTGTAARALTFGASFEASTVALPTTTVSTNRLDVGFVWNAATSKWRCVASA
jgi:hypothetical protein